MAIFSSQSFVVSMVLMAFMSVPGVALPRFWLRNQVHKRNFRDGVPVLNLR